MLSKILHITPCDKKIVLCALQACFFLSGSCQFHSSVAPLKSTYELSFLQDEKKLCGKKNKKLIFTSIVESCGSAHSPLSLIHSSSTRAAHLHADICNLLRFQRPDHHHVHMAELVSPDILKTNTWGPSFCPYDSAKSALKKLSMERLKYIKIFTNEL